MFAAQLRRRATTFQRCLALHHRELSTTSPPLSTANEPVFSRSVLNGKVALVSGGTGAIGFAIARLLTQHGARTAILSRSQQRATDAAAEINQHCNTVNHAAAQQQSSTAGTPTCIGYECDVTSSQHINSTIKQITNDLGAVSILVTAHGISHDALIPRMSDNSIVDTIQTNLTSCLFLVRAVSRSLLTTRSSSSSAGGGSIVLVGSIVGEQGNVGQAAYAASKAGLEGMMRSASRELARYNVNVNLIAPGWIQGDPAHHSRTGMMGGAGEGDEAAAAAGGRWSRRLDERDWAGRPGRVDEVANVALFLCTPAASYIHGAVLHVDGGLRV